MYRFLVCLSFCCFIFFRSYTQGVEQRLQQAYKVFEDDQQLQQAMSSLLVIDAITGKTVFEMNSLVGLAPASTQKIITSAAAYELLGKDFRYSTQFGYTGSLIGHTLNGNLYIKGSGDPTLGSWRWKNTSEDSVFRRVLTAIKQLGINKYDTLVVDDSGWNSETIPDGWIWQDVGNYYGAGAEVLNWRENQYDLLLRSGNQIGDPVSVASIQPRLYTYSLTSLATSGAKGTGDNSYIYFPIGGTTGVIRGTIPVGESHFSVSGAMPSGRKQFTATLIDSLQRAGIHIGGGKIVKGKGAEEFDSNRVTVIHEEQSPVLDSIIYWFLKKSINLYGEALAKTIAFRSNKVASTENGVEVIKDLWKKNGINETELNIVDGSGLSPLNRVTTHAQVAVLRYAKGQPWFPGFYAALPEYNGMKMKSGTIHAVKGFCGYHTSKDGHEYIFSFLVNNYNGSSSSLVQKMYKVLDGLK